MHKRLIIMAVVLVVVAGLTLAAHELNLAGLLGLNSHAVR